jgi:hypothetical protein
MSSCDDLNLVATLHNLHARLSALESGSKIDPSVNSSHGLGVSLYPFSSSRKKVFSVYGDEKATDVNKRYELVINGKSYYFQNKALLMGEIQSFYLPPSRG